MTRAASFTFTLMVMLVGGCKTGTPQTAAGAAIMTSLAVGASAAKRSTGDCYVDCLPGTRCNRASGLCEALPCRGKCGSDEICVEATAGYECRPAPPLSVQAKGDKGPSTGSVRPESEARPIKPGETPVPAAALQGGAPKKPEKEQTGPAPAPQWRTNPAEADPAPAMDNPALPPPK